MSIIDEFRFKNKCQIVAKDWADQLNLFYGDGCGGYGDLTSMKIASVSIYSHESGSNRFSPIEFIPFIESAVSYFFKDIINMALSLQIEDLKAASVEAIKENEKIVAELKSFGKKD